MRSMISAAMFAAVAATGLGPAQAQAQTVRASYVVEPFTPPSQITIQGAGVRLRAEPFTNPPAQVLSSGSTGLPLNVVGIARLPDWNWYQVILKSGQKAFIRSDLTSAPSRGGAPVAALPVATQLGYPPASAPGLSTPATSAPAFATPASPPALTAIDSSPLAAPVFAPATPAASQPPATSVAAQPGYPPVSAPISAPATSAPDTFDAPIALTPRSSPPPRTSDPSGLESRPPAQ